MSGTSQHSPRNDELPLLWTPGSMTDAPPEAWVRVCQLLRDRVGGAMFDRWFAPVKVQALDGTRVILKVPNVLHEYWIEDNYRTILNGAFAEVLGEARAVELQAGVEHANLVTAAGEPVRAALQEAGKGSHPPVHAGDDPRFHKYLGESGLHNRFTFDTFVQGPNCRYSCAVAKAVADKPGKVYNPLFLHGNVGIGKTHLMQAIGYEILKSKPKKVVRYITSESFTNEYIDAVRKTNVSSFRNKYRKVDVLLVDDVQFFAGKDATQEEFFHTFNDLWNGHKQIVVTSDRAPSAIPNIEDRLVSRFEWGLATQIQSPDLETRIAILRHKTAEWTIKIEDWVLEFLATRISTNVRRLEGALMRVAAHISLGGPSVTSESLAGILADVIDDGPNLNISIDWIQKAVAEHFDIRMADMTSRRRPKNIALPRQIAMYLARELTKNSLKDIGSAFGGKDHGTVIHACKTVSANMQDSEDFRRTISTLTEKIKRGN